MKNFLIFTSLVLSLSSVAQAAPTKKIVIGLSMDTLKEERWQHDRDLFVQKAKELGAEVVVQSADGNDARQNNQAENLLTQGVDVLVVVPHNGVTAASIVEAAHKAGKKVISYDRLIRNTSTDLYLSFDNVKVGELQASYLMRRVPKGNYVLIGGAPTDNNAKLLREGQMKALQPAIDRGDIKIVADPWAREWQASEALKHMENALSKTGNNIQAVVASNDGTAGGAISALKQQKLEGKVLVSGQDAELAACQRIVSGSQVMTVYKPIKLLAESAAEAAVAMARGEAVKGINAKVDNGKIQVPSILMNPIQVDKQNIDQTIIADKYQPRAAVYQTASK